MASAPIFLTSADRTVTEDTNMVSCQRTRVTDAVRRASMDSMIPDRATAALRTSALPIMMMMSSLNPEKASRSEEHTSELQSLMRTSYAVFCLKNKKNNHKHK